MSKITLQHVQAEAASHGWRLLSDAYKNLDTELLFQCPEGHKVTSNFRKWRNAQYCPACEKAAASKALRTSAPRKAAGTIRVLALDDATGTTGYSIFDNKTLVHYGKITMYQDDPIARIASMRQWMMSLIDGWKPDVVAIEDIQMQQGRVENVKTFKRLAQLQGVLLVSLYQAGIDTIVVPPVTWRSTCNMRARTRSDQKREMQKKVEDWYGVKVTQDEADAIGIGYHTAHTVAKKSYNKMWGDIV